jgi:hypothetical protein
MFVAPNEKCKKQQQHKNMQAKSKFFFVPTLLSTYADLYTPMSEDMALYVSPLPPGLAPVLFIDDIIVLVFQLLFCGRLLYFVF